MSKVRLFVFGIVAIMVLCVIYLVVYSGVLAWSQYQTKCVWVRLYSTYTILRGIYQETGRAIPDSLAENILESPIVKVSENEYHIVERDMYYYPENWDMSKQIVLRYEYAGISFVCLANGGRAEFLFYQGGEVGTDEEFIAAGSSGAIPPGHYVYSVVLSVIAWAIIMAIVILMCGRFICGKAVVEDNVEEGPDG